MSRIVGHLDLDYFYAQVEEVENPSLRHIPVVVCVFSGRTEESGVVSTSNYEARQYGIKSGMPIAVAKRRLDGLDASFVRMDHGKYEVYSDRVMDLVRGEVDVFEQAGIDEAFFDLTKKAGGDFDAATGTSETLKAKILREEKLTCSVGLGPNKVVAKIASDYRKPDGLTVVREEEAKAFLSPLPVGAIYGVGPKTAKLLAGRGVSTISELAGFPAQDLADDLGRKLAAYLHKAANGIDDEPVVDRGGVSQLSRIITLKEDTKSVEGVMMELIPALKDLHSKLVGKKLFFRSVSAIGIGKDLSLRTRSRTLETPADAYPVLEQETRALFGELLGEMGEARRVGVRLGDLQDMADQSSIMEFTG